MINSKNKERAVVHRVECFLVVFVVLSFFLCCINYGIHPIKSIGEQDKEAYVIQNANEIEKIEGWKIEENDGLCLTSQNIDPKIFLHLEPKYQYIYFDIEISKIYKGDNTVAKARSEIYYAIEDRYSAEQKVDFTLGRGHNIVKVPMNNFYSDFRIDLVAEKDITVSVKQIGISSYFKGAWFARIMMSAFLIDIVVMALVFLPKNKTKAEGFSDNLFAPIKRICVELGKYIKENKVLVIWTLFIAILSYGLLCTYYTIYIDEERQIMAPYATQGWIAQGRFGNYFFERYLLAGRIYTSFVGDAVAAVLLGVSALIQCFNFDTISKNSLGKFSKMIFVGISTSMPYVCGAYMVVGIYNIEISLAICLASLAVSFILEETYMSKYIYAVFLLALSISIYQAFVPLYVTNIVLCSLLWVEFSEKLEVRKLFSMIINSVAVCICALVLYYILNGIFIRYIGGGSAYLNDSFVGWGKGNNTVEIIGEIFANIRNVIIGSPSLLWGGIIYRVTFAVAGIYALVRLLRVRENRSIFVFLLLCSLLAPFCMHFVIGSTLFAGRTLLGLPSLLGAIWLLVIEKLTDKGIIRGALCCVAFYLIFLQVQYINQYFLADYKRYQQDQIITQEIISDIREACAGYTQMPIVLVGTYDHEDNGLAMSYELAGSFYTVDNGSIARMVHFMQAQGYNVDMPTSKQIADSYNYLNDMPVWPVKGSVKNVADYVIVKLSEPSQMWIDSYFGAAY